jgi:hypothetical protein
MADQFYDDVPALANQISNDIDQIEKSLGFLKDVFQNFVITWSDTDASTAYPVDIEMETAPSADTTAYGVKFQDTAGESLAFGNLVYRKSDSKLWKTDADASTTMPGIAMAIASINADASGFFIQQGFVRDDSWNWTVGGLIYASTTAGAITQTAPTGSGDQVQVIGVAWTADIMLFNPSMVLVEV